MALTKAAKKGLGLLITLAVVGGGIYAFQHNMPVEPTPVQQAQPEPAPMQQALPEPASVPQAQVAPAAEQPQPQTDASSNRGMQFLLNQGKK